MPPVVATRPTILDVAARAGVSKSLVSLVMRGAGAVSDEKRRLVLEAAEALGYRPNAVARSLVRRRTNLLGIVLANLHDPACAEIVDGIQAEAEARGYRIILGTVDRHATSERRALDTLLELRVEGVVLASAMRDAEAVAAAEREVPVVLLADHDDPAAPDAPLHLPRSMLGRRAVATLVQRLADTRH